MRRLRRYFFYGGLAAIGLVIIFGLRRLDDALGTGRLLLGLGAGLTIGVGGFFVFIVRSQQRAARSLRLRQPPMAEEATASYDWQVVALDGTPFYMEAVKGEILFLNVWSTLCAPCIAELPSIERLRKVISGDGVRFMCVATDADVNRVRDLVAANGWTVPVFVHPDGDLPAVFDSDYIPATYVVSPDGKVVYQHTGAAQWDHPRVVSFLRALALKHGLTSPLRPAATIDRGSSA